MKKLKFFLMAFLMMTSFTCVEAKKKKKKRPFPMTFLDFQGRKTTRMNQVFAAPLDRPDFDFLISRNFKNGKRAGLKVFFEREADISPGNSFPIAGNFGGSEVPNGTRALVTTSFTFGKRSKRKEFSATGVEGTVNFITDDKGITFLILRGETTNGAIYRIDNNGERREKIKDINLVIETDIPFVYGYITQYQDSCFQERSADGIQQECVTTLDEVNTFK